MKKFVSIVLALTMILSMATVAFAETTTYNFATKENDTATISFTKTYEVSGNACEDLYPAETLSFTATPATWPTAADGEDNITIDAFTVDSQSKAYTVTVNLPVYTAAGVYTYNLTEDNGETQGVTNYGDETVSISVLVSYDYDATDYNLVVEEIGVTLPEDGEKVDTFTNTYEVGSLTVTKEVTGNLGDTAKEFDMTITLTSANAVLSDICDADGNVVIAVDDWSENGTATVEFALADGGEYVLNDIPEGVEYEVVESDEYSADTDKNGPNGYDAPLYNGEEATSATGSIDSEVPAAVEVTNNKETEVATGISMDTIPYIVVLAVAVMGLVAVVANKRRAAEF